MGKNGEKRGRGCANGRREKSNKKKRETAGNSRKKGLTAGLRCGKISHTLANKHTYP